MTLVFLKILYSVTAGTYVQNGVNTNGDKF